jgi:Mg2+ and Co2+ transporter CorA
MITEHKFRGETWIDVDNGTPEEIHSLMNKFSIHPFVAKELTSSTPKPRIEFHDRYVYCILHFPVFKHSHADGKSQEIDFIIGKDALITARYDTIDALHKFSKDLEVHEILEKNGDKKIAHDHILLMRMLRELYSSLFEELEYIDDITDRITDNIFKGREKEMVISISEVTRTLLDFKRTTDMHHKILETLRDRGGRIFGDIFSQEIESILVDYLKINTTIKSNLEMLRELRDTNNSLLTSKQNETVKQLTVLGGILLPLNLLSWIFAMRVGGVPLETNPNGFWIVIVSMIAYALIAIVYSRHKKWI